MVRLYGMDHFLISDTQLTDITVQPESKAAALRLRSSLQQPIQLADGLHDRPVGHRRWQLGYRASAVDNMPDYARSGAWDREFPAPGTDGEDKHGNAGTGQTVAMR